jgi:hypothetical protein
VKEKNCEYEKDYHDAWGIFSMPLTRQFPNVGRMDTTRENAKKIPVATNSSFAGLSELCKERI